MTALSVLRYDPSAAVPHLSPERLGLAREALLGARDEVRSDVELWNSGDPVPTEKQPLDAGFVELPRRLLDEGDDGLVAGIESVAADLRAELDRFVVLGIGGSYMGARALFEALRHRWHNELPRAARGGVPRLYFEGNNVDNDTLAQLVGMLPGEGEPNATPEDRWGLTVISKSGGTLETSVAFRLFRRTLEGLYGADSDEARKFVVPITGETGRLRELSKSKGYPAVFPIPDGVGGRFSVLTAVGLLPAAVLGLDLRALLAGAADATDDFFSAEPGANPTLDYTAVAHVAEVEHGMHTRILCTWGNRLEALGLWYDQLLAESLGKHEQGALPLTVVNTRDLHSRGQQHQEGRRDKLVTNLVVERPSEDVLTIPEAPAELDQDELNALAGTPLPTVMDAAIRGTNQAYAEDDRPTADFVVPTLDEYAMGQLFQTLMLATVVEGRLVGTNPYGQPGVEAYKTNMNAILGR